MSNVTKNIVTILGLLTVAFAGYYFYAQKESLEPAVDEFDMQEMLASTEVFIARSQELGQMDFNLAVFEDSRFNSLRSFTDPIESQPVGRTNPFAPANGSTVTSPGTE